MQNTKRLLLVGAMLSLYAGLSQSASAQTYNNLKKSELFYGILTIGLVYSLHWTALHRRILSYQISRGSRSQPPISISNLQSH
jgi:hypothetical protein